MSRKRHLHHAGSGRRPIGLFVRPTRRLTRLAVATALQREISKFVKWHTDREPFKKRRRRAPKLGPLWGPGVPWNNNNAEHAIKAFASLRSVIGGVTTENGLQDFLVLLSICETCRYKNIDFLDFLRSGSKNIDDFANTRRERLVAH